MCRSSPPTSGLTCPAAPSRPFPPVRCMRPDSGESRRHSPWWAADGQAPGRGASPMQPRSSGATHRQLPQGGGRHPSAPPRISPRPPVRTASAHRHGRRQRSYNFGIAHPTKFRGLCVLRAHSLGNRAVPGRWHAGLLLHGRQAGLRFGCCRASALQRRSRAACCRCRTWIAGAARSSRWVLPRQRSR